MAADENREDAQARADQTPPAVEDVKAWEQIAEGRFMPRRIRGSFRGGKLG